MERRKISDHALDDADEVINIIENPSEEGIGIVYKAEDLRFNCLVVLKFLLLSLITLTSRIGIANPDGRSFHAQNREIKFEHIGPEQGLSQSTINCILQDHQGFMWFGTQEGLNKYDGYGFTVYQKDIFDSTSLSVNNIGVIYEDHTHTLWIGTSGGGLNRLDREKEQFTRFVHDPKNRHSLSNDGVNAIYEDHSGMLWIGTDAGLNKFDRSKKQFIRFAHDPHNPNSLTSNAVLSIYKDHTGTLWIGTESGLNKLVMSPASNGGKGLDHDKEQFTHFVHDPNNPHSLSQNVVISIYEDRSGTLWIGTGGGLSRLSRDDREKGIFTNFVHDPKNLHSLSSDTISSIYEDHAGTLWIGTRRGLSLLIRDDRAKEQFTRLVYDPTSSLSLSENEVLSIYEDRSGTLWIGTLFGGLNRFDRGKEQFTQFSNDPNNPHGLSYNAVNAFYKDHTGTLWVGTHNGLNRFDHQTKQFTRFFHDPKNPHSLSNNNIASIYEDLAGFLWIGTWGGGLNRFDREKEKFYRFINDPNNPHSISSNSINVIYEDSISKNTLWIGNYDGGLNRFNRDTGQFTRFVHDPKNLHSISNESVWSICQDPISWNILWIATIGGLNCFDRNTGQFSHFVNDPQNPNSLSNNWIWSMYIDHSGALWLGTAGGGFNRFNRDTKQFTHYTEKNGLPDNTICGILEDDHGRLWLSTGKGISCFDPQTNTFRNYDITDGLASNKHMVGAYYKSFSGEMFFGSFNNGFTTFHPDSIKDNPYVPPIVISSFKRYNTDETEGTAIVEKGISAKKETQVSYKDNILSFEFAALSYRNAFKNQYAYKLEGFNDNWIQLGTKRDVTFTNLDPGEYTLRVKGSNNDGVWNEEGTALKITITPPWWRTRWAYAFYVLLFTILLFGWRRFELNRAKMRNELRMQKFEAQKLHEIDQMKSRFFANISHEFRTPLTLILGPVEQMRGGDFKGNVQEAYDMILRNGRRLLRLINQLLDLARLEAGRMSLQARPENIVSFLKGLVLSFVSAAERKRIQLSITAEEESLIVYFDRDKLEKIVSNLLSNALKFTPEGGRVTVAVGSSSSSSSQYQVPSATATASANIVELSVTDTGPGIPADQRDKIFDRFYQLDESHTREHEGTGIGLALTKELVELHYGEILVYSEVGKGTTFVVRLPLGKEHLKPEEIADSEQLSVGSDQFPVFSESIGEDRESGIPDRASRVLSMPA